MNWNLRYSSDDNTRFIGGLSNAYEFNFGNKQWRRVPGTSNEKMYREQWRPFMAIIHHCSNGGCRKSSEDTAIYDPNGLDGHKGGKFTVVHGPSIDNASYTTIHGLMVGREQS